MKNKWRNQFLNTFFFLFNLYYKKNLQTVNSKRVADKEETNLKKAPANNEINSYTAATTTAITIAIYN